MPKAKPRPELTPQQLDALRRFRDKHGRTWKAKLKNMWEFGHDTRQPDGGLLRQIRNEVGPVALKDVELD